MSAIIEAFWPGPRSGCSSGSRNAYRVASRPTTFLPWGCCRCWGSVARLAPVVVPRAAVVVPPRLLPPLVPVLLAVNWFGDSLDGTVARVRRQERPRYGYYLDHVIDLAGTIALFAGLAVSGFMHPLIALGTLSTFLL